MEKKLIRNMYRSFLDDKFGNESFVASLKGPFDGEKSSSFMGRSTTNSAVTSAKRKTRSGVNIHNPLLKLLFIGLPLIPLIVFWFVPMLISLWLSFTDWDYISPSFNYVQLDNYTSLLTDQRFFQALQNTAIFALGTVVPTLVIGFVLALLINSKLKGIDVFKGFLFAPWVTPMVGMSIVWSWIYDPSVGPLNAVMDMLNLPQYDWLTDSKTAMLSVIIVTIWKNAGWAMLFYSDSLKKIPKELFEVTELEGASTWQKVRMVLIPLVSPTTLFLFIIQLLDSIQAYDQINVLTQGGPSGSTRTLLYLYFQTAFEEFNMGGATALSVIILLIGACMSFLSMQISKKYVHY